MTDKSTNSNPYEDYCRTMMDMQVEMMKSYMQAQQNGDVNMYSMPPFMGQGFMPPFMNPQMMHANPMFNMAMAAQAQNGFTQQATQSNQQQTSQQTSQSENSAFDPLYEQAQAMLDDALGEDASTFNEILGTFGMNDKEFWKGAVIGAAAALLLGNENVRGKLLGAVSGAADLLKSGGSSVKDAATNTASTVKDNVASSSEIFRDTVTAGKQGFQESVQKHKPEPVSEEQFELDTEAFVSTTSDISNKDQ